MQRHDGSDHPKGGSGLLQPDQERTAPIAPHQVKGRGDRNGRGARGDDGLGAGAGRHWIRWGATRGRRGRWLQVRGRRGRGWPGRWPRDGRRRAAPRHRPRPLPARPPPGGTLLSRRRRSQSPSRAALSRPARPCATARAVPAELAELAEPPAVPRLCRPGRVPVGPPPGRAPWLAHALPSPRRAQPPHRQLPSLPSGAPPV